MPEYVRVELDNIAGVQVLVDFGVDMLLCDTYD